MARTIGIRHRIKKTAKGEARPTQVATFENGSETTIDLKTEDDELNFVRSGLKTADQVAAILGGSGDNLAYALARRGQDIGAKVFRIPPFVLQAHLGTKRNKDEDAQSLARLLETNPSLFYEIRPRDMSLIRLREALRARTDAMKARIACEQRIRQHLIGQIFCSTQGLYPEGRIEKLYDEAKANDEILRVLLCEERRRERDLVHACEELDVYQRLFAPIEGCGPMIASRVIGAVIDIRRFPTKAQFRAYCGVHVLEDGRFPRRRNDEVANWQAEARQALYLLGDQFNRRPNSEWGQRLRAAKEKYRTTHPETIVEDGKKRYYPGHVHKMAIWYTLGKFAEALFKDWWKLEGGRSQVSFPTAA